MNGAVIGEGSLVGAGALVTEGSQFPPRSMILGSPARLAKTLSEEEAARLKASAQRYVANARRYRDGLRPLGPASDPTTDQHDGAPI